MTVLRMEDESGNELGMLNWFAVHGTSMTNTNQYISGDNKGYASYLFEKYKNGNNSLPGIGPFVAAFGQR
jgi:neutral ceramidase